MPADDTSDLKPQVSIIIVSFNTRELLRDCLNAVIEEAKLLDAEIWVVDNASRDGSADMVAAEFPAVKLIRSETNLGFGVANNIALEQATGRWIVLLNSDAFFHAGSLLCAIGYMAHDPRCGYGAARLVGRDGAWQPSARKFHSLWRDFTVLTGIAARHPRSFLLGGLDMRWRDESRPMEIDWGPGAFAILRPEALTRAGIFDPRFFLYYEEVDLCRRIRQAGFTVRYWPDVVVTHLGGESSRKLTGLTFSSQAAQVQLWRMRSTLLYYRKHHGGQAALARWMEVLLYKAIAWKNSRSRSPERAAKAEHNRTLAALMQQGWKDTNGGRVSPPAPW